MKVEVCRFESANHGDPCRHCGEPLDRIVRAMGRTIRGRDLEAVGPRNLECANGHLILDATEPIAKQEFPVIVE